MPQAVQMKLETLLPLHAAEFSKSNALYIVCCDAAPHAQMRNRQR